MIEKKLLPSLGENETRNYKDLFIAYKQQQGLERITITGASFDKPMVRHTRKKSKERLRRSKT